MNRSGQHTMGHGEAQAAYLADVAAAGPDGISTNALMAKYGVTKTSVSQTMHKTGEIFCRRKGRGSPGVWVLKRYATPTEAETMRKSLTIKPQSVRQDGSAPAAMPKGGPKITRAELFVDRRFTFTPPPGWVGEITKDWRARRLEGLS